MRFIFVAIACIALPCAAYSEGLWNKVKKGASNAGEAIGNTANDVGNVASDVGNAVGDTLNSTTEMVGNEETPQLTRQRINSVATDSLALLFSENAAAQSLYEQSYGYAVFDARQLTIIGATAGYGRGVAVEKQSGARTYMKMGTGGVGLAFGIGGFERKIVVLFEDSKLFDHFVDNGYDATAQAGAMFGEEKESEEVRFVDGRSIFVLTKNGWKVSATAAGTKYWKDAALN
jgi:hypothetical protein